MSNVKGIPLQEQEKSTEVDEKSSDIDTEDKTYSKLDDSELTLIERTGETVQTETILSGMETLKESPFLAMRTSDFATPESKADESLDERSGVPQSSVDESGGVERSQVDKITIQPDDKERKESDSFDENINDELRSDWDVLDDIPTSRKMLQKDVSVVPRKDSSSEGERSAVMYGENLSDTVSNPEVITTPLAYGRNGPCCEYATKICN